MVNKTREEKLVIQESNLNGHKEGYDRVLFREEGATREFIQTLGRGEHYRKAGFWQRTGAIVTYYVDTHPHLRYPFSSARMHSSRISGRTFYLDFTLKYRIANPERLVKHLHRDPLELIEKEIKESLSATIEALPWEEILDDKTNFVAAALPAERRNDSGECLSNLAYLKGYADDFGVKIYDIDVQRRLSEDALRDRNEAEKRAKDFREEKGKAEYERKLKELREGTDLAKLELEQERAKFQRRQDIVTLGHQKNFGRASHPAGRPAQDV